LTSREGVIIHSTGRTEEGKEGKGKKKAVMDPGPWAGKKIRITRLRIIERKRDRKEKVGRKESTVRSLGRE